MTAISFQPEFLNALLSGSKQQTTRPVPPVPPKHPRFKVGDVAQIYNQQRRRIVDKPLRRLTDEGYYAMVRLSRRGQMNYPVPVAGIRDYNAHFLGRVRITEVYDIRPCEMTEAELNAWAVEDGFKDFASARCWFEIRYGARWMYQCWTIIRWTGWTEWYFKP